MTKAGSALLVMALLMIGGCGSRYVEVDHPFYLASHDPDDGNANLALFRCPHGTDQGCAIDGLPQDILAAGANDRFVVLERVASAPERAPREFLYFARVPEETRGWGNNPERIIGPIDGPEFERLRSRLGLPEPTVRPMGL